MSVRAWEHVNRVKPGLDKRRPVRHRKIGRPKAVAVASFRVEVKFGRDLCLLERLKIEQRVFYVNRVVLGLQDKGRRSVRGWVDATRELLKGRSIREITGVYDDDKVGTGADGTLAGRLIGALVFRMVAEHDGEVASGGETEHADAVRIDAPCSGVRARDAHGLLSILEIGGIF